MPWEQLVTDGHVRAARVRWLQPWLIAGGIAAVLGGVWLGWLVSPSTESSGGDGSSLMTTLSNYRTPVSIAVTRLPDPSLTVQEAGQLPPAAQLASDVEPGILKELQRSGHLPTSAMSFSTVSPADFWRKPWPKAALVTTETDKVKLVGAFVNVGTVDFPTTRRWIGVFRKSGKAWQYASAEEFGYYEVPGLPSVPLENIPLTLKPVLPPPETN